MDHGLPFSRPPHWAYMALHAWQRLTARLSYVHAWLTEQQKGPAQKSPPQRANRALHPSHRDCSRGTHCAKAGSVCTQVMVPLPQHSDGPRHVSVLLPGCRPPHWALGAAHTGAGLVLDAAATLDGSMKLLSRPAISAVRTRTLAATTALPGAAADRAVAVASCTRRRATASQAAWVGATGPFTSDRTGGMVSAVVASGSSGAAEEMPAEASLGAGAGDMEAESAGSVVSTPGELGVLVSTSVTGSALPGTERAAMGAVAPLGRGAAAEGIVQPIRGSPPGRAVTPERGFTLDPPPGMAATGSAASAEAASVAAVMENRGVG